MRGIVLLAIASKILRELSAALGRGTGRPLGAAEDFGGFTDEDCWPGENRRLSP
jgi:hypothetical protein